MTVEDTPAVSTYETCDRCGREAVGMVGDETLCESCYHGETSCCGSFCREES